MPGSPGTRRSIIGFVRRLFEHWSFHKLVPDQSLILNGPKAGGAKIRAARASDGSYALFYSPRGESFTLDKTVIKAERVREIWYDPRYGTAYEVAITDRNGFQTYTPPGSGRGNDWVLILEDASRPVLRPSQLKFPPE
jgi:hypothetical protein